MTRDEMQAFLNAIGNIKLDVNTIAGMNIVLDPYLPKNTVYMANLNIPMQCLECQIPVSIVAATAYQCPTCYKVICKSCIENNRHLCSQRKSVMHWGSRPITSLETNHLVNILKTLTYKYDKIQARRLEEVVALKTEIESRSDITVEDFRKYQMAIKIIEETDQVSSTYNIRIQSPFILTPTQVKSALGIGYKVISVEAEKDIPVVKITNIEDAVESIIKIGYKSLVRAHHPDLGGSTEVMMIVNKAKQELMELLESVK